VWKKDEPTKEKPQAQPDPIRDSKTPAKETRPVQSATIGRSITIKGEVSGDEDLLIEGHIDGTVHLKEHAVTVGEAGQVTADVTARIITVQGRVDGDLTADEKIILRQTAQVEGDLVAPRVVLEDGAQFRGGVDMGDPDRSDPSGNRRGNQSGKETTSGSGSSGHAAKEKSAATSSVSGAKGGKPAGKGASA
jgi:cytoskeletal protein CcmA (bactofilin family)